MKTTYIHRLTAVSMLLLAGRVWAVTYYVAPTGSNSNVGSQAAPFATLQKAHDVAVAGDTIFMRGGTYTFAPTVITRDGTSGNTIKVFCFTGEVPIIDGATNATGSASYPIFLQSANWWHFKGIEIKNGKEGGIRIDNSSNNIFEFNKVHNNGGASVSSAGKGFSMFGTSGNNLFLNNDSYANRDPAGNNADGFQLSAGSTGNVMRGNRAWRNSDDGFDAFCLSNTHNCKTILYENNWSFENGEDEAGTVLGGGKGFKMGGGDGTTGALSGGNQYNNNLSFGNLGDGFDNNSSSVAEAQRAGNTLYNNTAWNNLANFTLFTNTANNVSTLKNNISFGTLGSLDDSIHSFNSFDVSPAVTVNSADFQADDTGTCAKSARQTDGSLPNCTFLKLVSGSDLIDKGTNVGLPFVGSAPDLGAFEFSTPPDTTAPTVSITAPGNGATVSGPSVLVSANASDNIGVSGVQFKADGANLGAEDTSSPYSVSWNTTTGFPDGPHTVSAVARDAAGNTTTSSVVNVTVNNTVADTTPPSVSISAPPAGTGVSGNPTIVNVSASDNVAVTTVQIMLDGVLAGTDTAAPYSFTLDTSTLSAGTHTIQGRANDAAGNLSVSSISVVGFNGSAAAFWPFDVPSPNPSNYTALNDIRNGNEIVLSSGASLSAGHIGNALTLNGTTGAALATSTRGMTATQALTLAAWVKHTDAVSFDTIVSKGSAVNGRGFAFGFNGANLYFGKIGGVLSTSTVAPSNGVYHHVAVTYAQSTGDMKFYLDGVLSQTINEGSAITQYFDSDPFTIGNFVDNTTFFNGQIDDMRIYNSILTDPEILAIATEDLAAPTVAITSPADDSTISGTVSVTASAGDDVGVVGVQFQLDQVNLGTEDLTAPYSISLNTIPVLNGLHSLTAVARDASGRSTESEIITVNVSNADTSPPTATITSPSAVSGNPIVAGTISLTALATDNQGVAGVQFKIDGLNYGSEITSSPYTVLLNTTTLTNGDHSLQAVARDTSLNTTTSATRTFTVANALTNKVQYSMALQTQQMQAIKSVCGPSPQLFAFDGDKPADLTFPDNGQILLSMQLPTEAFNDASAGIITQKGTWREPAADATGTLKYARIKTSGGIPCIQGPITLTGGGGLLTFPTISVTVGTPWSVSGFKLKTGNP